MTQRKKPLRRKLSLENGTTITVTTKDAEAPPPFGNLPQQIEAFLKTNPSVETIMEAFGGNPRKD